MLLRESPVISELDMNVVKESSHLKQSSEQKTRVNLENVDILIGQLIYSISVAILPSCQSFE